MVSYICQPLVFQFLFSIFKVIKLLSTRLIILLQNHPIKPLHILDTVFWLVVYQNIHKNTPWNIMTVRPGHLKKKICQVCKIHKKLEISENTFLHLRWFFFYRDQVLSINRLSSHVKMYRNSIIIQNHLTLHYCLKMVEIKDLAHSYLFPN